MLARIVVGFGVASLLATGFARAQLVSSRTAEAKTRAVSGTVVDREGSPVADAEIALIEHDTASRRVVSDASGHFALGGLPGGMIHLRVRRTGFETQTVSIDDPPGERASGVFITLQQEAAAVDSITLATGPAPDTISALLRGFYAREKTSHMGHFIDEKRLDELKPQFTSDALRTVPGVVVRPASIGNEVRIRGCAPLVWVDGSRAVGAQVDELAPGRDVAAIEIYESLSGVPAEFTDRTATCGTILLWLKTR
ncbi:MAG TPA: carboxypeptidase regulatory-like domain-containing protein [Gemmatimonadaceae bacterium]|jgi:hypothetical protein|nr:carboxypeptidase regulatory-like domain-containing protein [Gemmatimonadaceae bacterium]